jgi:hypothetical protein
VEEQENGRTLYLVHFFETIHKILLQAANVHHSAVKTGESFQHPGLLCIDLPSGTHINNTGRSAARIFASNLRLLMTFIG